MTDEDLIYAKTPFGTIYKRDKYNKKRHRNNPVVYAKLHIPPPEKLFDDNNVEFSVLNPEVVDNPDDDPRLYYGKMTCTRDNFAGYPNDDRTPRFEYIQADFDNYGLPRDFWFVAELWPDNEELNAPIAYEGSLKFLNPKTGSKRCIGVQLVTRQTAEIVNGEDKVDYVDILEEFIDNLDEYPDRELEDMLHRATEMAPAYMFDMKPAAYWPISRFAMSEMARKALNKHGISRAFQIIEKTEDELRNMSGIGPTLADNILIALKAHHLEMRA